MRWSDDITDSMDMSLCQFYEFTVILIKVSTQSGPTHVEEPTMEVAEKYLKCFRLEGRNIMKVCGSSSGQTKHPGSRSRVQSYSKVLGVGDSTHESDKTVWGGGHHNPPIVVENHFVLSFPTLKGDSRG